MVGGALVNTHQRAGSETCSEAPGEFGFNDTNATHVCALPDVTALQSLGRRFP